MLKSLELENVGPASRMMLELAPRLNLLTGDNGLGKSFLLDVAWWALTRRWPQEVNQDMISGFPARPRCRKGSAFIRFTGHGRTQPVESEWKYSQKNESWIGTPGRPWLPGLVVYAHADGSFFRMGSRPEITGRNKVTSMLGRGGLHTYLPRPKYGMDSGVTWTDERSLSVTDYCTTGRRGLERRMTTTREPWPRY